MLLPAIRRFLRRRRFPTLMLIGAVLFLINLAVPDPIPFIDEVLLLIGTLIVGSLRERKRVDADDNVIDDRD
jgi:hypothetical protein